MTLASGAKLGRYEIRSQLAAGGMGDFPFVPLRSEPRIKDLLKRMNLLG